jgi:hypothetical protein
MTPRAEALLMAPQLQFKPARAVNRISLSHSILSLCALAFCAFCPTGNAEEPCASYLQSDHWLVRQGYAGHPVGWYLAQAAPALFSPPDLLAIQQAAPDMAAVRLFDYGGEAVYDRFRLDINSVIQPVAERDVILEHRAIREVFIADRPQGDAAQAKIAAALSHPRFAGTPRLFLINNQQGAVVNAGYLRSATLILISDNGELVTESHQAHHDRVIQRGDLMAQQPLMFTASKVYLSGSTNDFARIIQPLILSAMSHGLHEINFYILQDLVADSIEPNAAHPEAAKWLDFLANKAHSPFQILRQNESATARFFVLKSGERYIEVNAQFTTSTAL